MSQPLTGNDVLMGGGNSNPPWKFENPGTTRVGKVLEPPRAVAEREYDPRNPGGGAPRLYPSGDPIMGVNVTMQGTELDPTIDDDDGKRTFYCEGRYLKEAVRNAVQAAGAKGLEVGGQLTVTFTHREDPDDKRSRKFWEVNYTPAGNAALMGDEPPTPAPAPAPAPDRRLQAVPNPTPAPAAAPTPLPTPAATNGDPATNPVAVLAQIKGMIALGLPDAAIAQVIGVDHTAIAAVRNLV